jgi:hypothetical protein
MLQSTSLSQPDTHISGSTPPAPRTHPPHPAQPLTAQTEAAAYIETCSAISLVALAELRRPQAVLANGVYEIVVSQTAAGATVS